MKKYLNNLKKQEKRGKEQRTEKINEKMVNYWYVNISLKMNCLNAPIKR